MSFLVGGPRLFGLRGGCGFLFRSSNRRVNAPAAASSNASVKRCYASACDAKKKEEGPKCYYAARRPECGQGLEDTTCKNKELPRFDWLYYRTSDKAKRTYQKTWADCIEKPKIKRVCVPETPKYYKRHAETKKVQVKKLACPLKRSESDKPKCPYVSAPGCIQGRRPPSCLRPKSPSDCHRVCCPYPSFSECRMATICLEPLRAPQCNCLVTGPLCAYNNRLSKKY